MILVNNFFRSDIKFLVHADFLAVSDDDARADYSLGIDWLLKASYEGHEGALMLLSKSLKTGRGINDRNITEVETCLAMTPAERSVRKAARELFNCLANGEQHITVAQLEKKMRQIYNLKSRTDRNEGSRRRASEHDLSPYHTLRRNVLSDPTNNITEAHLITAAMNYSSGRLPPISSSLTLSTPHPDTLNHIPYFHRLLFHPLMFIYLIYHKYMNLLTKFPGSTVNCVLFILLLTYTTSFSNLLLVMPVTVYYISIFFQKNLSNICNKNNFHFRFACDDFGHLQNVQNKAQFRRFSNVVATLSQFRSTR